MTTVKTLLNKSTTPPMKRELLKVRDRLLDVAVQCRKVVGQVGPIPDFAIIGAQKGGTTYLYNELIRHPQVVPALTKEVHFFDSFYHKGHEWYRAYFPQLSEAVGEGDERRMTGEASPCYLYHPHAPHRMAGLMADARLIVLLRNPVSRAYSQYHHEVRLGFETLPFEAAIGSEQARLDGELERMLADERYEGHAYMHHGYLARGRYAEQLERWFQHFPREQFLIIKSEDFYRNTPVVWGQVLDFLGLPQWAPDGDEGEGGEGEADLAARQYKGNYSRKMDPAMQAHLRDYFRPHNQRLYALLGVDFGWDG